MRFVNAPLLDEVLAKVGQVLAIRSAKLQRTPEVPFTGREPVQLGKDVCRYRVDARAGGVQHQRAPYRGFRLPNPAGVETDGGLLRMRPGQVCVDTEHDLQYLLGVSQIPAAVVDLETTSQRIEVLRITAQGVDGKTQLPVFVVMLFVVQIGAPIVVSIVVPMVVQGVPAQQRFAGWQKR